MQTDLPRLLPTRAAALAAVLLPMAVVFNLPPSASLINQALGIAGFGLLAVALGRHIAAPAFAVGRALPLLALLGLQAAAALASGWLYGAAPITAWGTAGMCLGAALMLLLGVACSQRGWADEVFAALATALLVGALVNVAACAVQMFLPHWADGVWIAASHVPGRAIGNLRQPNLVALLCILAAVCTAWLHGVGRMPALAAWVAMALLAAGLAMVASRAGFIFSGLLAAWGLWEWRQHPRAARLLLALPVLLALGLAGVWWAMQHSGGSVAGAARLAEGAASAPRLRIITDAWALTLAHPLTGVGWGELNMAWTLAPNPLRTQYYFDHTHVLPLQWAVELGLPLALLLCGLWLWSLGRAAAADGSAVPPFLRRSAWMLLLVVALHNGLEFPYWYSYFLLPTALVWGLLLAAGPRVAHTAVHDEATKPHLLAGLGMVMAALLLVQDYMRMVPVFSPGVDAKPIAQRVADASGSLLFSAQVQWGAATRQKPTPALLPSAEAGAHAVLDVRLLWSWARMLEQAGEADKARFLAARLREFPGDEARRVFERCQEPQPPWQCEAPARSYQLSDFRPPRPR